MQGKNNFFDFGVLVLRVGLGGMFILHGFPMMFGGPAAWKSIGVAMGALGVHFLPTFWGFCAAFAELVGGTCLVLGLAFLPACIFLAFTMFVAMMSHLAHGDGLIVASHAIEDGIVFISLIFIGPGSFSADSVFNIGVGKK